MALSSASEGGNRASFQPTAGSFPEQEGAERLPVGQDGGFPAVPTSHPHFSQVRLGPSQTRALLTYFYPSDRKPQVRVKGPHPSQRSGGGKGAEPLPWPRPAPRDRMNELGRKKGAGSPRRAGIDSSQGLACSRKHLSSLRTRLPGHRNRVPPNLGAPLVPASRAPWS